MIERIDIQNIKRFKSIHVPLDEHVVIVGPNNCGKTTLLQTIALWSEVMSLWGEKSDPFDLDDDGHYPSIEISYIEISSIVLKDWKNLWYQQCIDSPASIQLRINGETIGFEFVYRGRTSVDIRPMKEVPASTLKKYIRNPFITSLITPMSGVDRDEPPYRSSVIPTRIATGHAGTVVRNLLYEVSRSPDKWSELQSIIQDLFLYQLTMPIAGVQTVYAGFQDDVGEFEMDLSGASSGFLQVLMIYAIILLKESSTILLDELDAHLHIFLQEKLYRDLKKRSRLHGQQLIIATHSERLIKETNLHDLRVLSAGLNKISDEQTVIESLYLNNLDIIMAQQFGCVLYLEGKTDLKILRTWAYALNHPLYTFLESPFCKFTAEDSWRSVRHFKAVRIHAHHIKGVELQDRNNKGPEVEDQLQPDGMKLLIWKRYEIENYLIHPSAILRWMGSIGDHQSVECTTEYMREYFPPAFFLRPLERNYFDGKKGKMVLREVCEAAKINIQDTDFCDIAYHMHAEEIHPEVIQKLDIIADHFRMNQN
ncbi:MAG: AAA family ATPase [Bacteroidetes bacterium]|nr:AAA family ATPase [Bacteroidota bacterium]